MVARFAGFVAGLVLLGTAWAQEPALDLSETRPAAKPATADQPEAAAAPAFSTQASEDTGTAPPSAQTARAQDPAWKTLTEDDFTYQSCRLGLSMLGVSYAEEPPLTSPEDPDCGIARPLRVTEIQPGVSISGSAQMRCATARQLALWIRNELAPAIRHLPGAPKVSEIIPGSTYQCRARVGGSQQKLSEHALGNAFDVAGLKLSDGQRLMIAPRDAEGSIEEAVQKAIRYGACLYFTTVLGPGSNEAHNDHLHFDIIARKNGWRLCE